MENTQQAYTIGVVTYINRYHTYFKQSIESLRRNFPDKQIICVINGHPDKVRNIAYLKEVTNWLSGLNNVKYITFEDHQSLAKCWNWILLMSSTEDTMIMNDDIVVHDNFRADLEKHFSRDLEFFAINKSFSHFVLKKNIVSKVGWFDERFLGVGQEDGDYLIRMAQKGIPLESVTCRDILNFVAPNPDPSFQKISSTTGNKYSSINKEFMDKKWHFNHINDSDVEYDIHFTWNNEEYKAKLKEGMETPVFYDYVLLSNVANFTSKNKDLKSTFNDFKKHIKNFFLTLFKRRN